MKIISTTFVIATLFPTFSVNILAGKGLYTNLLFLNFAPREKKNILDNSFKPMVLILDGSSETGAHVWSKTFYLICISLDRQQLQILNYSLKPIFFHTCATCSELPFNTVCHVQIPAVPAPV